MATRMPFGKYRGTPISELPMDYVAWLRRNVPLYHCLRLEMQEIWGGEFRSKSDEPPRPQSTAIKIDFKQMRRRFAAKYHPDHRGGSCEAMSAINDVFDALEAAG